MANLQTAQAPSSVFKVTNQPKMLKTYVQSGGGSPRPESGQMQPRNK